MTVPEAYSYCRINLPYQKNHSHLFTASTGKICKGASMPATSGASSLVNQTKILNTKLDQTTH